MDSDVVLSQWAHLGAFFNMEPTEQTPDIEKLLIETAKFSPDMPRLFAVSVTWLTRYYRLVCRHRLTRFACEIADPDTSACLGLILSIAKKHGGMDHFNLAIKVCKPADVPKPLFIADRISQALSTLSKSRSCELGRRWGLWCEEPELKQDAIRPLDWITAQNPELQLRALFGGNLRASILETLALNPDAGKSESALAKHCYATRKAVREALDHLEFCQLVQRIHARGKVAIILSNKNLKYPA